MGLRGHPGGERLPERHCEEPSSLMVQMEQPPPVSPRVALRRQRPGPSLPDPTGCNPLLRAPAIRWVLAWWHSGRLALAVDPTLKGDQTGGHRHQRGVQVGCAIPFLAHHAALTGYIGLDAQRLPCTGSSGPRGNDRRCGAVQCPRAMASPSEIEAIRVQLGLASPCHGIVHLLRLPGRPPAASPRLCRPF